MKIDKGAIVRGIPVWEQKFQPVKELEPLCRKMAAEGSVLLKNDGALPFSKGERVAVFGRTQETYIKSGTGSGGLVRPVIAPRILDSFRENGVFTIDEELVKIYENWIGENPMDIGDGWTMPRSQKEMPLTDEIIAAAAARNDSAVVIIGRTAGEDADNSATEGSCYLSGEEAEMIAGVSRRFAKTVVVLNVGNLIDLSFMDSNAVSAVLYVWQGGQEGANALADMLSGKISPCGKLPDTQVIKMEDYPYFKDFGDEKQTVYKEDIYVGYRYFETFGKENVRYPFGYGLTYTSFDAEYSAAEKNGEITVTARVTNTGKFPSREVVQVYFEAPCGKLGTPARQLIGYQKTKELKPNESEILRISFQVEDMASYDDSGITGFAYSYVLEAGDYNIYAGNDVRNCRQVYCHSEQKTTLVKELEQIMPPQQAFLRYHAILDGNGNRVLQQSPAPMGQFDLDERIRERRPQEIPYTGDKGLKLLDVARGSCTMESFIAQLNDNDLSAIVCGEGMNSPKVMAGTGGAFGGVTDSLLDFGIPVCCVTDGPSGIRLDGGVYNTTALPSGYVFASSFDDALTEEIFDYEGIELFAHNIDALLGPGMNIHRHPLCGRNFEYFSEDPLLSGRMAAAQSRGVAKSGCSTTIKHFACNNQEYKRYFCESVVSERALREIYLKGFEIAVKEGGATAIMTAYNPVNGYWTASNYDLTTTLIRKEWGYEGLVMTDWWASSNCKGEAGNADNLKAMVRAHNDVFMVCPSAEEKPHNILEGLNEGYITRGDLQCCARHILNYIIKSPTFMKYVDGGCQKPSFAGRDDAKLCQVAQLQNVEAGKEYILDFDSEKKCVFVFEIQTQGNALMQHSVVVTAGGVTCASLSVSGNDKGKIIRQFKLDGSSHSFRFDFGSNVKINRFTIKQ